MADAERTVTDSLSISDSVFNSNLHSNPIVKDGRRRSNPLKSLSTSPAKAPDWQLSRVVTAQDTVFTKRSSGVNAGGYLSVRFSVTPMTADPTTNPAAAPGGTVNPNTEIRVWSEEAAAFVPMSTPITHTGAGAGTPYVVDVPNANGSILACFVTSAVSGFVAIAAQGFNAEYM
jgi:hypothetical protein